MSLNDLARELVSTYRKHGWTLRRVLSSQQGSFDPHELGQEGESAILRQSAIDALWFSRPSHNNREAWELRLISENPYALFETFEADETEDLREESRMEMEARMREKVTGT